MNDNPFTNTTDAELLEASKLHIECLQAENERLRGLVRDAFDEAVMGFPETDKMFCQHLWDKSKSKQELEGGDETDD